MPRDTFKRALDRMMRGRVGDSATITNYTDDGTTDKHGDPTRTEDTKSTGVPALFRRATEGEAPPQDSAVGAGPDFDVFVWVPDDETVHGADTDSRYSTRITDETSGAKYDVIKTWNEKNGTLRCACIEV